MVLLINNFPTVPSLGSGHVSMCLAYSGYVTDSVDAAITTTKNDPQKST